MIGPSNLQVGKKALVTCDNWFLAPDGRQYRGIFGTVKGVFTAEDTLGVRPNGKSTNWYAEIGNMVIAGCQIHYVIRTDGCNIGEVSDWKETEGDVKLFNRPSHIYYAQEAA